MMVTPHNARNYVISIGRVIDALASGVPLEPDTVAVGDFGDVIVDIALSLNRIADALEERNKQQSAKGAHSRRP